MSCMLLTGATSENWRAASPPGGTTLTVAALIKTDRKSGGWAKNYNQHGGGLLKTIFKMHGETDGSAWTAMTNGRWMRYFICAFRWFLSCFMASLGHSVRKICVRIFWCPLWGRSLCYNPFSSAAFDIPKSWSSAIIPDFYSQEIPLSPIVARLPDLIGTIPPFFPHRGTLWSPKLLQKGDGYMEVALVFVDVLQGFETFVHRTEILQRR